MPSHSKERKTVLKRSLWVKNLKNTQNLLIFFFKEVKSLSLSLGFVLNYLQYFVDHSFVRTSINFKLFDLNEQGLNENNKF